MLCPSPYCQIRVRVITSESESKFESSPPSPGPSSRVQVQKKIQVRVTSPVVHIFDILCLPKHENKQNIFPSLIYFNKLPIFQMNPLNRSTIFLVFIGHKFQNTCILKSQHGTAATAWTRVWLGPIESRVTISESESESESE